MNLETLKAYCEKKGYKSRADRFKVIQEIFNILPEEAKAVEQITRYFRILFPVDSRGEELESQWHTPDYLHSYLNEEAKNLIKQDQLL
jgi:hypothetical protein